MSDRFNARLQEYDRMIRAAANRWHQLNPGVQEDDLYQEGLIALHRAVECHDQTQEAFTSYLWLSIKRRMRRFTAANRDTIRVPETELMRSRWSTRVVSMSLGMQTTEDGGVLEDIIAAPAEEEYLSADHDLTQLLKSAIAKLTPKESQVLTALFYEEKKSSEVALDMGCTRQRVEQIRNQALNRLRHNPALKHAA